MVIVHLSASQRRIISPEKNENLGQLFKRFCLEYGYSESEYEFRGYLDNDLEMLGSSVSASIIKEVSLVQKQNSKEIKENSKNLKIREDRPKIIEQRTKILEVTPQISTPLSLAPPSDTLLQKRLPKRNAPKPPVVVDKPAVKADDSNIPDIEIPPPPEFMPVDNVGINELVFKSVECETEQDSMAISDHSSNNESVSETPDSLLHESDACVSFDHSIESLDSNENILNVENNLDIEVAFVDITIDNKINDSENEMNSDSDVEDVYEDESLFANFRKNEDREINIKKEENFKNLEDLTQTRIESSEINLITPDPKNNEVIKDEIMTEIKTKENISENIETYQRDNNDNKFVHGILEPDTVAEIILVHCPIAEMEDNDMSSSSSSTHEVIESQPDQIDGTAKDFNIKTTQDDKEVCSETQPVSTDLPSPKMRRIGKKSATVDIELKEVEHNQDPDQNTDISFVDGHPTDFPLTNSTKIRNPKFFWELPKQGKTMQFLSRKLNTIDIPETPIKKVEEREIPETLPKPAKQVQVIVQEAPTEQCDRPTYRPRQAKSLYFTAGKN